MTFSAGQKVRASALNAAIAQAPQFLGSTSVTSGTQPSLSLPIPSGYTHLEVVWTARSDAATTAVHAVIQFNSDTTNSYVWDQNETNNTTSVATAAGALTSQIQIGAMPAASATANFFGSGRFTVAGISGGTFKTCSGHSSAFTTATNVFIGTYGGQWSSTAAITSLLIKPSSGNLVVGSSISIYGRQ